MIENGNILFDGCSSEYYSIDFIIENKENMICDKFIYYDHNKNQCQAIVYLDILTDKNNELEAEINNIRRQINLFRKDMNLKIYNKIHIIFEKNEYWNNMDNNLLLNLKNRLSSEISFVDKLNDYKIIKTFNDKELKVFIKL